MRAKSSAAVSEEVEAASPDPYGVHGLSASQVHAQKQAAVAAAIKKRTMAKKKGQQGKIFWDTAGGF